jgi:Putative zincin peptidase
VIALAPLVVLTLAGVLFILITPALASYAFLGLVGNFSGAAGDVYSATRLLKQPTSVLIEDTEAGFRIWELESPV